MISWLVRKEILIGKWVCKM